jgi:serine/threonine-protein kinase
VRARVLITVVAWLLGAATATGGCLLAVSLLGAGFGVTGSSGHQLTTDQEAKALAAAERELPSPPTPSRSARARPATRRPRAARPTSTQTQTSSPTPAATPPTQSTTPAGTPFGSQGGTVVANCLSGGAHLITWSAALGYEVSAGVVQGPAPVASVGFESNTAELTMSVSCPGGPGSTPVESTKGGH